MTEFRVDEAGLDVLAAALTHAGEVLDAGRTVHASTAGGDLGLVASRHAVAVERWQGGLTTGAGALAEIAATTRACAAAYRAGDDDQGVVFAGIRP